MQFLPSTITAALGGKVAAKGQGAQSGKTAGTARAAQEVFGNMLGEAKRVQASGASKAAAVAQQATQAKAAVAATLAPNEKISRTFRTNSAASTPSVQDMLTQAVAVANAPKTAAVQTDTRAATNTRAAENLVERVAGKHSTPVATADASAENIQNAQEAMLEAGMEQEAPKVKVANPYTRHTTDGVTYTLQEVSFTRQDLQELRATLVKEGVAPAKIAGLDTLIEMPDGATLGQVMLHLQGERTPVALEDNEMDAIDAQLSSVDPSGVLATTFLQAIAANNPRGALNMLDKALGELDATETIEITKSGMVALGKALGMDEKGLQEMAGQFGAVENATVMPAQFGALLAPVAEKLVADKANQEKLDAAISKTLKPIIATARQRMEKENQAHSLQDRKVAQSKAQIERSVQEKSRDILDETLNAAGAAQEGENVQRQSAVFAQSETVVAKPGHHGSEKVRDERAVQPQAAQNQTAQSADNRVAVPQTDNAQRQPVAGEAFQQQGNDANTQQDARQNAHSAPEQEMVQGAGQSSSWQELLSKVDVQPVAANVEQMAFNVAQPAVAMENAPLVNTQPEPLARHLVNQVESGMLRTLRNGATSLELQLHPQELGTLNIVLTSYNGEVSARIIADKSETVEMLNHQLDTIRASLEEQGVKVEKVDVELRQNDQENSDHFSWQDADSHNSWQEQDARQQTLSRIRNLASIRNNTANPEMTTLERSVHIMGRTAENAATGLDLVA